MDFFVLILGTDANAYYMARCCYEEYKIKPHLIGQRRLAFTKFSNILSVEYCPDFWKEKTFLEVINNYAKNSEYKKILLVSTNETYTEYISKNKEKLNKKFVYNLPSIEIIKTLTNKENFYKTYENSELTFPKTIYFDAKKDKIESIKIQFPLVLKPANVVKYNHVDSVPELARCRGNSLITTIQDNGLWFRAKLFNTTVARDVYNIVKEGGLDKCSFAFKIKRSEYDAQTHIRTILEIDKVYDLSIVDIPAYADTEVEARSLVELDNEARKKTLDSENEARKRAYIRTLL